MSINGTNLLFEGFLQKRKDTMKLRWSTYWFRLQNTTLFFYTKRNGCASHLRGYYYIYTVQSVREVQRVYWRRFVFEITMTNGKKKVLAAETAALRKEWIGNLWRAMHLSTSGNMDAESLEVCEQRDGLHSITHGDSVTELYTPSPSAPSGHSLHADGSIVSSVLSSEEPIYQNSVPACFDRHYNGERLNGAHWPSGQIKVKDRQDDEDYDVLPTRNTNEAKPLSEKDFVEDKGLYDFPLSNRRAVKHQASEHTEGVYDVPSSLLREMSDHTLNDSPEEGAGLLEDVMSSLRTPETDWEAPGATPDSSMSVYL